MSTSHTTDDHALLFNDDALFQCQQMMKQYWNDNPDLYRIIQQKRSANVPCFDKTNDTNKPVVTATASPYVLLGDALRGEKLQQKIRENQRKIRQSVLEWDADITPRTAVANRKSAFLSLEEERDFRSEVVAAQIRAWRSLLPNLIKKFSRLPDYRRAGSVKHKLTVLMLFGLFAFVFRLSSRREMNRELTGPVIFEHLKKLFPDIDSIPHADTLSRVLETMNPQRIEAIHISLVKSLINKKKFRQLLIQDALPITIDGTQKLYRDGLLQDDRWCERAVGDPDNQTKQQYIYVVEANITLRNGLTIPLMTEYLYREHNELMQAEGKQDSETTAFERLADRLKIYFPRLKIILFMDALYATQHVMGLLHEHRWEYIIRLPKKKLTDLARRLNEKKDARQAIPEQPAYRERKQEFYWENDITYGYEWQLQIHLVACLEHYYEVNKKTGDIENHYSEHAWISSIAASIDNVHELFNGGARKKELIEDSINTEKNRGYHYKRECPNKRVNVNN